MDRSANPIATVRSAPDAHIISQRKQHHHRIGSLVGSLGRQGFQLPPSKQERETARTLLFSDRLEDNEGSSAQLDTPLEESDCEGAILEEGVLAPSESERVRHEHQRLLERSGLHSSASEDHNEGYGALEDSLDAEWDQAVRTGKIETSPGVEIRTIAANSFPLAITFFLQYSLIMSSLFSVGHLGKVELGAVSLGAMTASITGVAFIQGLSSCLDTLCSQAYGAGRPDLVGLYFQKGVLIVLLGLSPILAIWYRADLFLPYVVADEGEDTEQLIALASTFIRTMILAMPGLTLFECGKKFLQAQNIFHASTIVLMICAPLNIVLTYTLVWNSYIGMGFIGAPIAIAITNTLLALILFAYVIFVDGMQCWNGFTSKVFLGWGPLIRLAIPGLIMVESEFLAYEIMTLASSYLGTSELATQTILSSITSLAYEIPFAVGCAVSTRVANFIGAGFAKAAKTAAGVAIILAVGIGLLDSTLMYSLRFEFSSLFSSDKDVIAKAAKYIPLSAAMHLLDAVAAVLAGVLRAQGRQRIGGFINLASYYLIGVPMGLFLCFGPKKLGLVGIWLGFILALGSVVICSALALRMSRWSQYVSKARLRM